jgi:hypothetical protein
LDLSWNYIARAGASAIGKSLATNTSLTTLNLAHNQFGTHGQQIGASLFVNKTLLNLDLSHNSLNGFVGMVIGDCMNTNTTLQHLTLEGNALGQSGGRAIVQAVTSCVCQCKLALKGCSFMEDWVFDRNRPSSFSPYTLDMGQPYQRTIMHELCTIMKQRPGCKMVEASFTPAPELVGEEGKQKLKAGRMKTTKIEYDEGSKKVTEGGSVFKLPADGVYAFRFVEKFHLPELDSHVADEGLERLIDLVKQTPTLVERRELLTIACKDMFLLCSQAQFLVGAMQQRQSQKFEGKRREKRIQALHDKAKQSKSTNTRRLSVIGAVVDVEKKAKATAQKERDTEEARVAQAARTPPKPPGAGAAGGRVDRVGALTQKLQSERVEIMQAKDVIERVFSKIIDQEDLFDFVHNNLDSQQIHELIITSGVQTYKFNSSNPTGHWRFDLLNHKDQSVLLSLAAVNEKQHHLSKTDVSGRRDTSQHGDWNNFRNATFNKVPFALSDRWINEMPLKGILEFDFVSTVRPPPDQQPVSASRLLKMLETVGMGPDFARQVLDSQVSLKRRPGLDGIGGMRNAKKRSISINTTLLEFHMMASSEGAFFTSEQVIAIMDKFPEELAKARVEIMISCFSKTIDLENWDRVMCTVSDEHALQVRTRLGPLNVWNPLKPYSSYVIDLSNTDENVQLSKVMQLAVSTTEHLKEDFIRSQVPLMQLYAKATLPREPLMIHVAYSRNDDANPDLVFKHQAELLKFVLLGTTPVRPQILVRAQPTVIPKEVTIDLAAPIPGC